MKIIHCDGKTLEIRDAGPVIMRLLAPSGQPIKLNGWRLLEDDEAREVLRGLLDMEVYSKEICLQKP